MSNKLTLDLCSRVYDLAHDTPEPELLGAMASHLRMAAERIEERMIEAGRIYPAMQTVPAYFKLADKPKAWRTEEILTGRVLADFNDDGNLIGIEVVSLFPPIVSERVDTAPE